MNLAHSGINIMTTKLVFSSIASIALAPSGFGADLLVPAQFASIQAAVDAASHGDVILVSPGTYVGFSFGGKVVTVRGVGVEGAVVIDQAGAGRAISAPNITLGEAVIDNITIRNAALRSDTPVGGAGINAIDSRLAILNVVVENCAVEWTGVGMFLTQGAGLRAQDSAIRIERCRFVANVTTANNLGSSYSQGLAYGSAVAVRGGSLQVRNCHFESNSSIATTQGTSWHDVQARGAAVYVDSSDLLIEFSNFVNNSCSATQLTSSVASCQAMGAAVFVLAGPSTSTAIRASTFTGNQVISRSSTTYDPFNYNATYGGAIRISGAGLIEDCTFLNNTVAGGLQQPADSFGGGICVLNGNIEISRCVVSGNTGGVPGSSGNRGGGGIAIIGGAVTINSTQVCGNHLDQIMVTGGGVLNDTLSNCVQHDCGDCAPPCDADLTENGVVDGSDLGALLAFWGPTTPVFPQADINRDGVVSGADLGFLLSSWGNCP